MIQLSINNKKIEVEEGLSVMKAAQQTGVNIPNMCWHDELDHFTSCMLCLVKDKISGRLFPSCSVKVHEGMEVVTDDEEIFEARKTALELLLSEHVGDCEAPCQLGCPAHMNIPLMNRLIADGKFNEALSVVRRDIALPSVLGRICLAPCEGACHRKTVDQSVSICLLKQFVGDKGVINDYLVPAPTGFKVAVIGAGPSGLAAAYHIQLCGIQVTLYDKELSAGGQLRTHISRDILPEEVLDTEIKYIIDAGVKFIGGQAIDANLFDELLNENDAIVVAFGTVEANADAFGLKTSATGILVNRNTYQTSKPKVYATGNALRTSRLAIRSVAQGKEVAYSIWQFLNNLPLQGEPRLFNSRFGKLVQEEFAEYLKESVDAPGTSPCNGVQHGFTEEEAIAEAKRCLRCDCRAIDECKLRLYADAYKADQRRFKTSERKKITKLNSHAQIIYEPQKCVRCGICVRLAEKDREKYGLTYIGRGFDIEVAVPFNDELNKALSKTAAKVADSCPTGALSLKACKI